MKLYKVEFRAVITLAAQDTQKATLHSTGLIKESPHLIYVLAPLQGLSLRAIGSQIEPQLAVESLFQE